MSASSRRRRALAAAGLVVAAVCFAGCAAIPDSGPVRPGLESLDLGERGVLFNPPGPMKDASPEDIVRGFVRAASSSSDDYETAREFLAPTYASQWDPWMGVLIDDGAQQLEISDDGIAVLSLRPVASVDANGNLTPSPPDGGMNVQFELAEIGGQWRITSAPAGIILDRNTFTAVWTMRQIYFVTADGRLVAESRWFLNRLPMLSTQIIRELLAGPSESMAGASSTAFPLGTTLLSGSVPVADGTATIDLSAELFDADEGAMELIKSQISGSLHTVPGVQRFVLSVHGTAIDQGPVLGVSETQSGEGQYAAVIEEGVFGALSGGELHPIDGLSQVVPELDPRAVTVAADRSAAALVNENGAFWVSEGKAVEIDDRPGLLVPSLDPFGFVWLYDPASPGVVTVQRPEGDKISLELPWLEGRTAVALRVSMGGNRIAALVQDQGQSAVLVAGIARDSRGIPLSVNETASTSLWTAGSPVDLDWIGDSRFAALTEGGLLGNARRITVGGTGWFPSDEGSVNGAVSLSGGNRLALLRVLDDQRRLYSPQGDISWQLQENEVELLSKSG